MAEMEQYFWNQIPKHFKLLCEIDTLLEKDLMLPNRWPVVSNWNGPICLFNGDVLVCLHGRWTACNFSFVAINV